MHTHGWAVYKAPTGNQNLRCFMYAYVIYERIHVWWYVYAWLRCVQVYVGFENADYMFACASGIVHVWICILRDAASSKHLNWGFQDAISVLACVSVLVHARTCACMDATSSKHLSWGFEYRFLYAFVCVYDCTCVNMLTRGQVAGKAPPETKTRSIFLCVLHVSVHTSEPWWYDDMCTRS